MTIKSKIATAVAIATLAGSLAIPTSAAQARGGWGLGAAFSAAAIVGATVANSAAYGGYYARRLSPLRLGAPVRRLRLLYRHREGLPGLLKPGFLELRPARTPPAFPSRRSQRPARMVPIRAGLVCPFVCEWALGMILPKTGSTFGISLGGLDGSLEALLNGGGTEGPGRRMSEFILETEDLTKEFAGFVAVNGVNLRVERGTIHALIGPNGAGKTTCFNLLTKFLQPTRGRITYKGADITAHGAGRRGAARHGALVPDLGGVSASHGAGKRAHRAAARTRRLVRLLALEPRAELVQRARLVADRRCRPVRCREVTAVELPYGRKRALEIATTLALDPEMLLLDEPTAGMGHEDIERITALIKRVSAERTVLMVEHNLSVVENLCHRITVLTRGRVLAEGDYATVANNPQVKEAYMGTGHA